MEDLEAVQIEGITSRRRILQPVVFQADRMRAFFFKYLGICAFIEGLCRSVLIIYTDLFAI